MKQAASSSQGAGALTPPPFGCVAGVALVGALLFAGRAHAILPPPAFGVPPPPAGAQGGGAPGWYELPGPGGGIPAGVTFTLGGPQPGPGGWFLTSTPSLPGPPPAPPAPPPPPTLSSPPLPPIAPPPPPAVASPPPQVTSPSPSASPPAPTAPEPPAWALAGLGLSLTALASRKKLRGKAALPARSAT